jgi:hypothetical protein
MQKGMCETFGDTQHGFGRAVPGRLPHLAQCGAHAGECTCHILRDQSRQLKFVPDATSVSSSSYLEGPMEHNAVSVAKGEAAEECVL